MRYPRQLSVIFVLLILSWLTLPIQANEQNEHAQFLPVVATESSQQPEPRTELVYKCQCGSAAVWINPNTGVALVTFLSHDQGGRVLVASDDGQNFTVLPNPTDYLRVPDEAAPSALTPGLKDAPGMAVEAFGKKVLWLPMRTKPDGRYDLWRVVW